MHTALSFDLVGEDVLITGCGPIGVMAAAIARHVGARHVVVTDVNEYRLNPARKMGATRAVNVATTALSDVERELGMTGGFDVGMEMSGTALALRQMLDVMNHGGSVALLGIPNHEIAIDWNKVILGLTIKGIYGARDVRDLVQDGGAAGQRPRRAAGHHSPDPGCAVRAGIRGHPFRIVRQGRARLDHRLSCSRACRRSVGRPAKRPAEHEDRKSVV